MKKSICFIAATALVFVGLANAQIYKSVDANGVVTFSDTPPKGPQEKVEKLQTPSHVNSMQPVPVAPTDAGDPDSSEAEQRERSASLAQWTTRRFPWERGFLTSRWMPHQS